MQDEMATLTLPILVRTLFGTHDVDVRRVAGALDVIQGRMKERYQALVPLPDTAWTPGNLRLRRAVRELDQEVGPLTSASMSRDEVMTMLFAGHETTALTLAWTWHLLGLHPEQEEKLHVELDAVLGGRAPSTEDLPRLGAVTRIVKEVMRLYPPVYAFGRDAVRDTDIGGHRVRKGASVIVAPWVLHRDPRFVARPDEFQPERWTPEFERTLPRHAYLPFGGGARMCLGKGFAMNEAVLIIASLAQRFRFVPVPGHRVELWPTFTLRSRHGLPMRVEER